MKKNTVNTKLLPREALLSTFGCSHFECEILKVINDALAVGQLPNFKLYNLEETNCECRTDRCCWNEAEILARLEERGVWDKVKALLKAQTKNLTAHRNNDGTFTVKGYPLSYAYVGEYANYREMDADAQLMLEKHPNGYVCHVLHNAEDEYVLMLPKGSEYIQLV